MSYLEQLRATEKKWKRVPHPSVESVETPKKVTFDTLDTSPLGPFPFFSPGADSQPTFTGSDLIAIQESLSERAAIREYDGGESRVLAERHALEGMRVYRVRVSMDPGRPDRWATMIAPGCDLAAATTAACNCFGPERVLEVREHPYPQPVPNRAPTTSGDRPMPTLTSPQPHQESA